MKQERKRFKSEKAILKAIDEAHEEAHQCWKLAEMERAEADALLRNSASCADDKLAEGMVLQAKELRRQAKQNEARGTRLVESTAKRLGEALAAFKTELLFGEDRSVPV